MRLLKAALFTAFALAAFPSNAETREAIGAEILSDLLKKAGYSFEMEVDKESGEPRTTISSGGYVFNVRAKNCRSNGCELLLFFANFNMGRELDLHDFRIVNNYNDSEIFGRAYIFEEQQMIGIDLVIDLRGGVEDDYIRINAQRFPALIQSFADHYRDATEN